MAMKHLFYETTFSGLFFQYPFINYPVKKGQKAGILLVLAKCFWPTFLMGAVYQLVYTLLQFASPQILGLIISFVQSEDPEWHGYFYTALFAVVALLSAIADSTYWYNMHLVGKYLYILFRFGIKITYLRIYLPFFNFLFKVHMFRESHKMYEFYQMEHRTLNLQTLLFST